MAFIRSEVKIVMLLGLAFLFGGAHAARRGLVDNVAVFDITKFGAKSDPTYDNNMEIMRAWGAACNSSIPAKVVIPPGTFMCSEIFFTGPCIRHVTVEVHGSVVADTDISNYVNGIWFSIEHVDGVTLDGANYQGSFNGTGDSVWKYDTCKENCDSNGPPSPPNFHFLDVKNADVGFLSSVNSKGFHFMIETSSNVHLHNLKIAAPSTSPHTNAARVVSSDNVHITNSTINTGGGPDCVIWGAGAKNYTYSQVSCNGH